VSVAVLIVVLKKILVFPDIMLYILVCRYQHFGDLATSIFREVF